MLYQPQLPRPLKPPNVTRWSDITVTTDQLATQDRNLRQYLQNYLTKIFQAIVPTAFSVSVLNAGQAAGGGYTVNGTDQFIATTAGKVNLPATSGSGRLLTIKNVDPNGGAVTVAPYGTDTIDGQKSYLLGPQWQVIQIIDAAAGQWLIW